MHIYLSEPNDKIYLDAMKDAEKSLIFNSKYSKSYYIKAKLFFLKRNNDFAHKNILIAK